MTTPTRVAFAGDWHANFNYASRAIRHAVKGGAQRIVHLGDFGYEFRPTFVRAVSHVLAEAGVDLWFVDGNHEKFPTLKAYPVLDDGRRRLSDQLFHLPRGFRWTWGGVTFLAMGGAYSIDRSYRHAGESWWAEEEITDAEAEYAAAGGPVDVLVSHDCPAGVRIPGIDESAHMWPPLDLIRAENHRQRLLRVAEAVRPRVVWHGHYHRRYSTCVNLGWGPVDVHGLDCDGEPFVDNLAIVDVPAAD